MRFDFMGAERLNLQPVSLAQLSRNCAGSNRVILAPLQLGHSPPAIGRVGDR